jgi:hypothetical protein
MVGSSKKSRIGDTLKVLSPCVASNSLDNEKKDVNRRFMGQTCAFRPHLTDSLVSDKVPKIKSPTRRVSIILQFARDAFQQIIEE